MVMGRFRGGCRISGSKCRFNVIFSLKLSFSYTFLVFMFYSFNILYKMGRYKFGMGIRDLTFIYKTIKWKLYIYLNILCFFAVKT